MLKTRKSKYKLSIILLGKCHQNPENENVNLAFAHRHQNPENENINRYCINTENENTN